MAGGITTSFQIVGPQGHSTAICGIPLIRPVTVFFHPAGSQKSTNLASVLANSVRDFLLDLSPHSRECAPSCLHSLGDTSTCSICADSDRIKLLVLVGADEPFAVPGESWWTSASDDRRVLPVFASKSHPEMWLSAQLSLLNAFFWENNVVEATPAILSSAAVTADAHRLFISYRRLETEPLAEQLFGELTRLGFEVFLDRFSVPAAAQFQRRLHHELAEKSMVLLLESDRFGESKWTSEEIAYCKQYRLGLFSLVMPHGGKTDPRPGDPDHKNPTRRLPDVDNELRHVLNVGDFETGEFPKVVDVGTPGSPDIYLQWGPLTSASLQRVITAIKRRHDEAQLRRLETIRNDMLDALKVAHAPTYSIRADGMMMVDGGGRRYAIWITTRPPELPDFQVTYAGSQIPAGTTGVIVGHRQLLEPDVHRRLVWLSGVCRLIWVDEGNLLSAAYDMAGGVL